MIDLYLTEIMNFVKTVTVKNDHFAKLSEESLLRKGITTYDAMDVPYYQKITGRWKPPTPIEIRSLDTGTIIEYTRENLSTHRKTQLVYKMPSEYYKKLLAEHSEYRDIIKNITYPADIDTAVSAKNGTVLTYDTSVLPANERGSILRATQQWFYELYETCYDPHFTYEPLYPHAIYAVAHGLLPAWLMAIRQQNVRTVDVHPSLIWDYLARFGIDDYRSSLNERQQQFLYRNMQYIMDNKGKREIMDLLEKNLLDVFGVSRGQKVLFVSEGDSQDINDRTCDFVTKLDDQHIRDLVEAPAESTLEFHNRLYDNGMIPNFNEEDTPTLDDDFAITQSSWRLTNFMELRKDALEKRHSNLFYRFIMDSLVYLYSKNRLEFVSIVSVPGAENLQPLTIGGSLALLHYCLAKTAGVEPTVIPTKFDVHSAYVYPHETPPTHFVSYLTTSKMPMSSQLPDGFWDGFPLDNQTKFSSSKEFMSHITKQCRVFARHVDYMNTNSEIMFRDAMITLYNTMMVIGGIEVSLLPYETYDDWANDDVGFASIRTAIDNPNNGIDRYQNIINNIMLELFPMNPDEHEYFVDLSELVNSQYQSLKELFVKCCSYNIGFLDTKNLDTIESEDPSVCFGVKNQLDITYRLAGFLDDKYSESKVATAGTLLEPDFFEAHASVTLEQSIVGDISDTISIKIESTMPVVESIDDVLIEQREVFLESVTTLDE